MSKDWKTLGVYFGYPECCIEAFLTEDFSIRPTRKLSGTGYIPCAKCNEKYTEEELTENINKNRECPTPFPDGGPTFGEEAYATVELDAPLDDDIVEYMVANGYATRNEDDENSCTATPAGNAFLMRAAKNTLKKPEGT